MKLLGIKDRLKRLLRPTVDERKRRTEIIQALLESVYQAAGTRYPEVGLTPEESEALRLWALSKSDKGIDLRNRDVVIEPDNTSYGYFVSLSFDAFGDLKGGTWYVDVPLNAPGSGLDVTALGALTNRPEPTTKLAQAGQVAVALELSRPEQETAQAGFEKECQDLKEQVVELLDANESYVKAARTNAAMANETQRAWAGQVEVVPMRPPLDQRIHNWDRDDEEDDEIDTDTDTDESPTEDDQ